MFGRRALSRDTAKDAKESVIALTFSTLGVLLTGTTLGFFTGSLEDFPPLLVLIPPAIAMRGHIFASLGSRLGTYLHTGEITFDKKDTVARQNIQSSFTLTFVMSLYLGVIAWVIAGQLGIGDSSLEAFIIMVLISLLAGFFSAFLMILFTFTIAFSAYRNGWNPDNITAPLITLVGDVITLPLLFASFFIVIHLPLLAKVIVLGLFIVVCIASFYPLKMNLYPFKEIVLESLPVFLLCGLLSSFSGSILGSQSQMLFTYTALIIILPTFLEDGGAIGGILAARISSALHTGEIDRGHLPKNIKSLFLIMHLIGLFMFTLIGIFGYLIANIFSQPANIFDLIIVSAIAGELIILIVNALSFLLSIFSFKVGVNPDNVVIPILTSFMDFSGTLCLFGVATFLNIF